MDYCARCLYPSNAKPTIIFDEQGICSGCRYHESRQRIDWDQRRRQFEELIHYYKAQSQKTGRLYDCIIPVSGGKDSHFQVWLIKEVYGMNPLLVTFNHAFNSAMGVRNLANLVEKSGCDLIRVTANPRSVKKIARHMLQKVGDITWHYHAGIRTVPYQIAVRYNIPLIIWGEHGFAELTGLVSLEDMVEFTKWSRQEHDMRGYEPHDLVGEESGLTMQDLAPYVFPDPDDIERLDLRGIYLSNFFDWNAKVQAEKMIEIYDFAPYPGRRHRTFNLYAKIEDHANEVHDYLKYLKFGYGRATDDASMEIRHGRLTREEGMALVKAYDPTRPPSLDTYLEFLDISETEFEAAIESMRDPAIWQRNDQGTWQVLDSVDRHAITAREEAARVVQVADRTFSPQNRHLYYNPESPPPTEGITGLRTLSPHDRSFLVL